MREQTYGGVRTWPPQQIRNACPSRPESRAGAVVVAGDILVIFAFIAAGIYEHGRYPWDMPWHTVEVLVPFALAWVLLGPLLGAYHPQILRSYLGTLVLVPVAWLATTMVGGHIRATGYFPGGATPEFLFVTVVFGATFLLSWRLSVAWILRRRGV